MKNWWKSLDGTNRRRIKAAIGLVILIGGVIPGMVLFLMYINDTGTNRIIYDTTKQEVIADVSFFKWLKDFPAQEKYYYIAEKITFADTVGNIGYRAKLRIQPKDRTFRKFLKKGMQGTQKYYMELHKSVASCVNEISSRNYDVKGYPSIKVRTMSIGNMNELCNMAAQYGYEWSDDLQIVQCNGDLPLDNARKNDCLNAVRLANYP
ncbi:MAG: hypothetical protein A2Y82_03995 [Candidatus Buchananbacteria bacterium RBG_13_36_9]|uniref:Uncharacterized protein n=1 Tax=Candidatus Buchananbacteria bacterium RBG_13_36_9 TaxID=1797530 RepID=A0A1G1XR72_9BACT|nr:MAG: hypothetical protein A2Y82_03995 [Candidatus Buchananbacteria bacterium RBG_13_36_9]